MWTLRENEKFFYECFSKLKRVNKTNHCVILVKKVTLELMLYKVWNAGKKNKNYRNKIQSHFLLFS